MEDGGGFCPASCCESCGSLSFSSEWFQAFGVVLCHQCKREEALISKGNAMTQYCLTVKDLRGLGCITKDNPQQKNWSAMKLYLRRQVEERALRKHGDLEAIRQLRHDKTQAKVQGWLAKRSRARRAEDEFEEEEEDDEDEGAGDLEPGAGRDTGTGPGAAGPPGGGGGGGVRVRLGAAASRVRARLASEYEDKEGRTAGARGRGAAASSGGGVGGAYGGGGGGEGAAAVATAVTAEEEPVPRAAGNVHDDDVEVF